MDMRETPTLILFDIDGTLLTADRSGRAAVMLALHELLGHPVDTNGVTLEGDVL